MTRRARKTRTAPKLRVGEGTTILGPTGDVAGGSGAELRGDELTISLDAGAIVDAARRAALLELRACIAEGVDPDGAPQDPLGPRAAAEPRVSPHRGFKSGHLADGLRSTAIRASGGRASARVLGPTDRNVVLAREAQRGHTYIATGSRVAPAIEAAVAEACDLVVAGRAVQPEQGEPTAAEEAGEAPRRAPNADRAAAARRGWETRRRRDAEVQRRMGGAA